MHVHQVTDGLWRWTAYHEEWKEDVGCVYYESADAIVLVDPLVPPGDEETFWTALDRDVERARAPVHVLVTIFWHARSAGEVVRRYGGRLWAPSRGRAPIHRRTGAVTDVFRLGDALPGGVQAFASGRGTEVVLWIPEHRALVPGDVIVGDEEGGLRLCPQSWLPQSCTLGDLRDALTPLLDLPVERVLVSHGEPVLEEGQAALATALRHAQSSSATAR